MVARHILWNDCRQLAHTRFGSSTQCLKIATLPSGISASIGFPRHASGATKNISKRGRSQTHLLPDKPARTRFAPSPTGLLHLGGLRTALYSYLLAKKTGGKFILRIEDTDQRRTVEGAQEQLIQDLRWAGLQWDEGPDCDGPHSPYNQSERTTSYYLYAQSLIEAGTAYRCFCPATKGTADLSTSALVSQRIGGCQSDCRHIHKDEVHARIDRQTPFVVRFAHDGKPPVWEDVVYGRMSPVSANSPTSDAFSSIADAVLLKTDGTPTYHLANVVDDHEMEITHVIRGTEWMSSTPLHIALYNAFEWTPPIFAHVGLLTDEHGAKLSKRDFNTDIKSFRVQHGVLPEALLNYLALMGWSNPEKSDVCTLEHLVKIFDMKFTRGNSVVALEKLWFLQRRHCARRVEEVVNDPANISPLTTPVEYLLQNERLADLDTSKMPLGARSLATYLMCILFIDGATYENPNQFLDRNWHFLDFREMEKKELVERTAKDDLGELASLAIDILFPEGTSFENLFVDWTKDSEAAPKVVCSALAYSSKVLNDKVNEACLTVVRAALQSEGHEVEHAQKSSLYKHVMKSTHDILRWRLTSSDEPGPSTAKIMAVLGRDETLRRIYGSQPEGRFDLKQTAKEGILFGIIASIFS